MAEFSENRHISNLINMSCKVLDIGLVLFYILIDRSIVHSCSSNQHNNQHILCNS